MLRLCNLRNETLALSFGLQLHIPIGDVHAELHGLAAILFADLVGLFLHKRSETRKIAHSLAGFLLGLGQRLIKFLYPVTLFGGIGAFHRKRLFFRRRRGCSCGRRRPIARGGMTYAISFMFRFM